MRVLSVQRVLVSVLYLLNFIYTITQICVIHGNGFVFPFLPNLSNLFSNNQQHTTHTHNNNNLSYEQLQYFQYIIVGAGATGCPLAYTLAEAGFKVLLIERGMDKSAPETESTKTINGLSKSINENHLADMYITNQGVRTHVGRVMGGGTSVSLAIYSEELPDYFDYLQTQHNITINTTLFNDSTSWAFDKLASPMPQNDEFNTNWRKSMERLGYIEYINSSVNATVREDECVDSVCVDIPMSVHTSRLLQQTTHTQSHSKNIQPDMYWGGYSLFNSSNNYTRQSSDYTLYNNQTLPSNLTLLTQHQVKKIVFDQSGSTPKATCVEYQFDHPNEDIQLLKTPTSIFSLFDFDWSAALRLILNPSKLLNHFFGNTQTYPIYYACVNDTNGEIILSSGAIMSSVILYNSGVGPANQIADLQIPLVKEIPNLGQNFSDRVFIPVGIFSNQQIPSKGHFDGYVCRGMAMRHIGNNCTNHTVYDENMGCTLTTMEEFSGAFIGESMMYASRYAFPPKWRNHPILDFMFHTLYACVIDKNPFDNKFLRPLCIITGPINHCFRKSSANFYFTSEPKSRGYIKLHKNGELEVNPNYMQSDQDFIDAIRGTAELVNQINGPEFYDMMEKYSNINSCPAIIYNGILDIFIKLSHHLVQRETHEALRHFEPVRLLFETETYERFKEKQISYTKEDVKRRLQSIGVFPPPSEVNETERSIHKDKQFDEFMRDLEHTLTHSTNYTNGEMYIDTEKLQTRLSRLKNAHSNQWAATFPPTLPDPNNAQEIGEYVLSHMASIWHHSGSAQMGDVVDSNFKVYGIDGLSIVDASVLNKMTRVNPTATLIALGRYAGLLKSQNHTNSLNSTV